VLQIQCDHASKILMHMQTKLEEHNLIQIPKNTEG